MVASTSLPTKLSSVQDYKAFLDKFDTFLLDCDDKRLVFVTNNSTLSRANYVKKFQKLGIEASEDDIFSSALATAVYLKTIINFPSDKKAYVIGESGIIDELNQEDNGVLQGHADFDTILPDPSIGAVVCGFDINLNYRKLAKAYKYLSNKDANVHFILTNADSTFPTPSGIYPGTGSLAQPLIHALKRQPLVMGKPNKPMLDCFFSKYETDPARTCMVGDRLDTDIDFGLQGNITTLLVLTGVSQEQEALDPEQPIKPTFIIQSFGEFAKVASL
ncbi:hypothetical protein BGX31_009076 [Mortierella sp. GBA43]|nr:hypothetical protein BGX31_009076 [Mortierella sp. GBA43]